MIKTIQLQNGETLTMRNTLGYKVRFQNAFGKPCDKALLEVQESQDTLVMLQLAYCMAMPVPTVDFETFCDSLDGEDFASVNEAVLELYAKSLPTEVQVKKAKN